MRKLVLSALLLRSGLLLTGRAGALLVLLTTGGTPTAAAAGGLVLTTLLLGRGGLLVPSGGLGAGLLGRSGLGRTGGRLGPASARTAAPSGSGLALTGGFGRGRRCGSGLGPALVGGLLCGVLARGGGAALGGLTVGDGAAALMT